MTTKMTEERLERWYSTETDILDRKLTETHELDQGQYNKAVRNLNAEFRKRGGRL